jgi:hypothetical protein
LFYHKETQKVLKKIFGDTEEIIQRDGSRNSDSNVPNANWNGDKFKVNWNNVNNQNDNLRPLEEISHNKGSL